MMKLYLNVFVVVCLCILFMVAYHKGYREACSEYEQQIQQLRIDNKQVLLEREREYNNKVNEVLTDLNTQLQTQRAEYENEIATLNADKLRDTVSVQYKNCSNKERVSTKTNTSSTRCYTESDLLRKVERSLAIGNECDELAIKYNALLETCKNAL